MLSRFATKRFTLVFMYLRAVAQKLSNLLMFNKYDVSIFQPKTASTSVLLDHTHAHLFAQKTAAGGYNNIHGQMPNICFHESDPWPVTVFAGL